MDQDVGYIGVPRSQLVEPVIRDTERLMAQKYNRTILRTAYAGYGDQIGSRLGGITEVLYPNIYYIQDQPYPLSYYQQIGVEPGDLDFEYNRMKIMFTIPEIRNKRGIPLSMVSSVNKLLESEKSGSLLGEWQLARTQIQQQAIIEFDNIKSDMMAIARPSNGHGLSSFETSASSYIVGSSLIGANQELDLLNRALYEVRNILHDRDFDTNKIRSFLEIYSFLKDPIAKMDVKDNQVVDFVQMYYEAQHLCEGLLIDELSDFKMITQAALESAYNAIPITQDELVIRHSGAVEMRYDYVDILDMPRSEFAKHPVMILQELVNDYCEADEVVITPIVIAPYQVPGSDEIGRFIVDGNNRSTAILMAKLFASINYNELLGMQKLELKSCAHNFVNCHKMDIEWEVDLLLGIDQLFELEQCERLLLLSQRQFYSEIRHATIPAMITLEASFLTLDMVNSVGTKICLLQPSVQAVVNERSEGIAFGAKKQSHGREDQNNIKMPVRQ